MRLVFLAIIFIGAFSLEESQYRFLFEQFRADYGKMYSNVHEALTRYDIFKNNLNKIMEHNKGQQTFKLGINQFGDLTPEEFKYYIVGSGYIPNNGPSVVSPVNTANPDSVDWEKDGAVTAVKNQGQCGACWAFSAVGAIESLLKIKTSQLEKYSEQQLVDCDTKSKGCQGGHFNTAFEYAKQKGLCQEIAYPYKGHMSPCKEDDCTPYGKIDGYKEVEKENEEALKTALTAQPVSVGVEASGFNFQFYKEGIITYGCGTNLNHAILAVGYGFDEYYVDYWRVKNSWGSTWGEAGYAKILRTDKKGKGMCGIAMDPSYPIKND